MMLAKSERTQGYERGSGVQIDPIKTKDFSDPFVLFSRR
jgi:hypothetical protein